MGLHRWALAAVVLAGGCATSTTATVARCTVLIDSVDPTSGGTGTQVVVQGQPLTTAWDSAVYLGDTRATVLDLTRDNCDSCDTCVSDHGCNLCGTCSACVTECTQDCVQTLTFEVPQMSGGTVPLVVYNSHGQSGPVDFTVVGPPDTGGSGGDSGTADTGPRDSATPDSGAHDSGPHDTSGPSDTGAKR